MIAKGLSIQGNGSYHQEQLAFFNFTTTYNGAAFVHIKTNIGTISTGDGGSIVTIEGTGYNYGQGLPIRCHWTAYTSTSSDIVYTVGLGSHESSGAQAHGIYKSSDNYVVLRCYFPSSAYFAGLVLNAYSGPRFVKYGSVEVLDSILIPTGSPNDSGSHY